MTKNKIDVYELIANNDLIVSLDKNMIEQKML